MMNALSRIYSPEELARQEEAQQALLTQSRRRRAEEDERERQKTQAEFEENERRAQQTLLREETIRNNKKAIVYSQALGFEICRRIGSGEVLTVICAEPTMPPIDIVFDWLETAGNVELSAFQLDYEAAEKRRDRVYEDQLIEIADDSTNDYVDKVNQKTQETFRVVDQEVITRSKLRIDMRLRILKARNPVKWGDNTQAAEVQRRLASAGAPPQVIFNIVKAPGQEEKITASADGAVTIEMQPAKGGEQP
jgi:terminase small subunit-like protein